MSRFAKGLNVIFVEEAIHADRKSSLLSTRACEKSGVTIVTPLLSNLLTEPAERAEAVAALVGALIGKIAPAKRIFWFYTPMMLLLVEGLDASLIVYDCMDELSSFAGASGEMRLLERRLIERADIVFTGGRTLFEAKDALHDDVHCFPSSVDRSHFATARDLMDEPDDQAGLPRPRLGFFGVIDERMDLDTLALLADSQPDHSIVLVGPVVKIDEASLPRRANLHYLGPKSYADLPRYLSGWDVALMPFALNEATRFISPTKTLEYLAGGKSVVSTPVADVVADHGMLDAVLIGKPGQDFVDACRLALSKTAERSVDLDAVDDHIAKHSWDSTQNAMASLIDNAVAAKRFSPPTAAIHKLGRLERCDVLVVGAGPAGCVMAERLAADGHSVVVIDKRNHIAGNTHDCLDAAGIMIHRYGPHIFHTNSVDVFDYLSRFTAWRPYEHRVLAKVEGQLLPMPINRDTLNRLNGLSLSSEEEAERYLASIAEPCDTIETSEDVVVARVGRKLYEQFFKNYSLKQWGIDPAMLDKSVTSRVPIRTNLDDRYFTDTHQAMPAGGYTALFERMLDHPNIRILVGTDYRDLKTQLAYDHLVFTGPIDEYFDHRFGKLPYRSLRFEHKTLQQQQFQPVATVNYPGADAPYTRITEYKHLTGQSHAATSITYEFGSAEGDPYYPIPRSQNQALYKRYELLARAARDVTFVGRLATYRYYNIDQVVGQALAAHRRLQLRPSKTLANARNGEGQRIAPYGSPSLTI